MLLLASAFSVALAAAIHPILVLVSEPRSDALAGLYGAPASRFGLLFFV